MSKFRSSVFVIVILFACFSAFQLKAQGPVASIAGTITDSSGAVIPGVSVSVKNIDTGITQTLVGNAQGRYAAPSLAIGNYEVTATAPGFQSTVNRGIILSVGSESVVDITLTVGQSQQTVTIVDTPSQVETTSSAVSSLVDQTQMRELPLNGRNFEQLILLAPGVQAFNNNSQNAFVGKGAEYSISGSRPEGQAMLMDSQDVANFWGRGMGSPSSGNSLGVEAIAEFQMLTSTYGAQYGGSGGAMNSVTKSGTNAFHGSAYEFLRNSALDSRSFFDTITNNPIPPFRKNQFGGSIGGPIKKDKAFFFVNYEGVKQALGETKVASVPDANAHKGLLPCSVATAYTCTNGLANVGFAPGVKAIMDVYPIATTPTGGGIGTYVATANQIVDEKFLLMRLDYTLSGKDSLFGRFMMDRVDLTEPFPSSPVPYWVEGDTTRNQFATLEERHIVSPTIVNSARVTFSRPNYSGVTTSRAPNSAFNFYAGTPESTRQDGEIAITGLSTEGPTRQAPYTIIQNKPAFADDVILTKGAHSIKVGLGILRDDLNTYNFYRVGGSWSFNSLLSFLTASPTSFAGVIPGPQYGNRDLRATMFTPYFQDDWKVTSRLTVNLGLRYTFETNPTEAHGQLYEIVDPPHGNNFTHVDHVFQSGNPSKNNWDPRVGLAFDPFSDHKTSIRAGFGIFHSLVQYHTYMPSLWSSTPELATTLAATAAKPIIGFPTPFVGLTTFPYQDSPGFDYRTNTTPYMMQWNVNVQRELFANTTLTVGYFGSRGNHLFLANNQNPPIATVDANGVYHFGTQVQSGSRLIISPAPLTNPAFQTLNDPAPIGWSTYNGLQTGVTRRFTKSATIQASYTYSKCEDIGSSWNPVEGGYNGGVVQNPYNISAEKGLCSFDLKHSLRINGLYRLPFHGNQLVEGWQLGGIIAVQGGNPFTVNVGFDQAGTQGTERPNYSPSNAGCNGQVILGIWQHWYNPNCFTLEAPGTLGNLGRTNLRGPGLTNADISLLKDTKIPKISEVFNVQFRAEIFNIFNHPNFASPVNGSNGGVCTQAANGSCNYAGNAGQITGIVGTSRQIQLGLKVLF